MSEWAGVAVAVVAMLVTVLNILMVRAAGRIAAEARAIVASRQQPSPDVAEARSELRRIAYDMRRIERDASARAAEARQPLRLEFIPRETETGLWCGRCNAPAGVRVTYTMLSAKGVTPGVAHQTFCMDCEQPLEPERSES